jgi:hypothetical protein
VSCTKADEWGCRRVGASSPVWRISRACLRLGTVVGVMVLCGACRRAEQSTEHLTNPHYFEVVSLTQTPDAEHTASLEGPDGRTWYGSAQPGLTLAECAPDKAFVTGGPDKMWSLVIPIAGALNRESFCRWMEQRQGGYAGVVLGGSLMFAAEVTRCPETGQLWISTFDSREEADRQLAIVQAGG